MAEEGGGGKKIGPSDLRSALSLLRGRGRGQEEEEEDDESNLQHENQNDIQVQEGNQQPLVMNAFGLSQSMDILHNTVEFNLEFSPPSQRIPEVTRTSENDVPLVSEFDRNNIEGEDNNTDDITELMETSRNAVIGSQRNPGVTMTSEDNVRNSIPTIEGEDNNTDDITELMETSRNAVIGSQRNPGVTMTSEDNVRISIPTIEEDNNRDDITELMETSRSAVIRNQRDPGVTRTSEDNVRNSIPTIEGEDNNRDDITELMETSRNAVIGSQRNPGVTMTSEDNVRNSIPTIEGEDNNRDDITELMETSRNAVIRNQRDPGATRTSEYNVPLVSEFDRNSSEEDSNTDDISELMETSRNAVVGNEDNHVHVHVAPNNQPLISIEELMHNSHQHMTEASRRREEEKNLRIINLHAVKEFRVPGEMSTASDTQSSDGENIVDVSTGISRRRRKETTDQSVHSLQSHPLMTSVTIRQRDAQLNMSSTTESEPECTVPNLLKSQEMKKPRKVPQCRRTLPISDSEGEMNFGAKRGEGRGTSEQRELVTHQENVVQHSPNLSTRDVDPSPPLSGTSSSPLFGQNVQVTQSLSGQDSDATTNTTDYPPSTTSQSGDKTSDSGSTTVNSNSSSQDRSREITTCTSSDSAESQSISQTLPLPLFSSTPNETEDDTITISQTPSPQRMPPPRMPPKKHSSEDTSTSSGTSVGILEKKKAVTHWMKDINEEGNEQRNTMTTEENQGITASDSTETLSPPLALATPSLSVTSVDHDVSHDVIPATPPPEDMDTSHINEVHENIPTSQDELFQEANDSQFEMDNELPQWMIQEQHHNTNDIVDEEGDDIVGGTKRPRLDSSSSSVSSSYSSPVKPLAKKQRKNTPLSPDPNEPPKWMKSSSDQSTSTSPNNVSIDHSNKSETTKSNVSPFRVPSGKPSPRKSQSQSPGVSSITSPLSKDSVSSTSTKSVSSGYLGSISSLSSSASGFTPPGSVTASMGGQSLSMERTVDSLPSNELDVSVHTDDNKKIDVNSSVDSETSNANNNDESGRSSVHSRCTTTTEDEEDGSGGVGGMSTVLPNNPSPEFDITSRDADVSNLAEETSSNNDTTPSVTPKVVQTFTGALTNEDVSIDLVNEGEEERENVNQNVDRERDKEKVVTKLMDVNDTAGDRESKESSSSDVIIIHVEERNKNTEEENEKVKVVVEQVELDKKKIEEKNEKEEDVREVEKEVIMIEEDENKQEKEDEMEEEKEDDDGEEEKEDDDGEKEDDDGEKEEEVEKEIDDGEDEKEKEEEKEVDVEKKEDDDEEEMEIEERNSTKMMVDEENENMIEDDNDIDDDETLDLDDEPVDKDTGANSTQMSFVLQLSPSQSQATQLHVGCTVIESQILNPQSGDLARLIPKPQSQATQLVCTVTDSQVSNPGDLVRLVPKPQSQATQLVCTVSDSQVSNPGDLARPIPEPVYESLQYSTVDTLQSMPTHISTDTNEPIQSDPIVVGVVEGGVHPVDSELSSSGTPFQFQLPNSSIPPPCTRITPPSETLSETEETSSVIISNKNEEKTDYSVSSNLPAPDTPKRYPISKTTSPGHRNLSLRRRKSDSVSDDSLKSPQKKNRLESVDEGIENEHRDRNGNQSQNKHETDKPSLSPFILGTTSQDRDEEVGGVDNLDDSNQFVMPRITGMEESESESVSTFDFSLKRPSPLSHHTNVIPPVSTTHINPFKQPSSLFKPGTRTEPRDQSQNLSNDPFEFHFESSDTPHMDLSTNQTSSTIPLQYSLQQESNSQEVTNNSVGVVNKSLSTVDELEDPLAGMVSSISSITNPVTTSNDIMFTVTKNSDVSSSVTTDITPTCTVAKNTNIPSDNLPLTNQIVSYPSVFTSQSITTPTENQSFIFNPLLSSTPPPQLSSSMITSTSSFSSPTSLLTPQAIETMCSSHPNAQYIRLRHITTVTTVTQYVSTEVVERSTGQVLDSEYHETQLPAPQEHRSITIQAEPLVTLPSHVSSCSSTPQRSHNMYTTQTGLTSYESPLLSLQQTSEAGLTSSTPLNTTTTHKELQTRTRTSIPSIVTMATCTPEPVTTSSFCHTVTSQQSISHPSDSEPALQTSLITSIPSTITTMTRRTPEPITMSSSDTSLQSVLQPSDSEQTISIPNRSSKNSSTSSSGLKGKGKASNNNNTVDTPFKIRSRQRVIAKWKGDRRWYAAVVDKVMTKKVYVSYMDGDHDTVNIHHVMPMDHLPKGTPVMTLEQCLTGSYINYSSSNDTFNMRTESGRIISCDLAQLSLTAETAEMAVEIAVAATRSTSMSQDKSPQVTLIFSGYVFMLTDHGKEQTGTPVVRMRKEVEEMIKCRGGFIMTDYKSTQVLNGRTFCLSNTHCRTVKYLTALAVNIPCVQYEWITKCAQQNKVVHHGNFLLPAGLSALSKQIIKWNVRPKNFLKVAVFIHGNRSFKEFWQQVSIAGGATILSRPPSRTKLSSGNSKTVVIVPAGSTKTIPQSILDLKESIEICTSDWLVESLLTGSLAPTQDFSI